MMDENSIINNLYKIVITTHYKILCVFIKCTCDFKHTLKSRYCILLYVEKHFLILKMRYFLQQIMYDGEKFELALCLAFVPAYHSSKEGIYIA